MQRENAQPLQHLPPVVAEILQIVARMIRKAGAVREHIANRDVAGDPRVLQSEPRQVLHDRRVPGDDAQTNLFRYDGRGDGFRYRRKLEDGIGIDRGTVTGPAHAKAFRVDGAAILHHGDGDARNARPA